MNPEDIYQQYGEALVFMGAGGPVEDWMIGLAELLFDDGIVPDQDPAKVWTTHISLEVSPKRTDLVLPIKLIPDVGKLAMWRLKNQDRFNAMWLSDYIENPQIQEAV
jgi:hypothetical protein